MSNYRKVAHSKDSDIWYTPEPLISIIREVFGGQIDMDPATSDEANEVIRAVVSFDEYSNGLSHRWFGNVWLNPPYSKMKEFSVHAIEQHKAKRTKSIVILARPSVDTKWFQMLAKTASSVCFLKGRIKFINPKNFKAKSPPHGNVLFLLTHSLSTLDRFNKKLSKIGVVLNEALSPKEPISDH